MFRMDFGTLVKRLTSLILGLLLLQAGSAQASDAYFAAIFAVQEQPHNHADKAHSFALFVQVSCDGDPAKGKITDYFTISWLPLTLEVKLYRLCAETGYNLTLTESFDWAKERGLCLSMWGPYQITPCLYERAVKRRDQLESGTVRYKAIDTGCPAKRVTNCIHAISDLAYNKNRLRLGSPSWGDAASYFITMSLRQWLIDPDTTHDWLMAPLGLDKEPLIRRDLLAGNPTTNPVTRAWQNLAHWHLMRHVK